MLVWPGWSSLRHEATKGVSKGSLAIFHFSAALRENASLQLEEELDVVSIFQRAIREMKRDELRIDGSELEAGQSAGELSYLMNKVIFLKRKN